MDVDKVMYILLTTHEIRRLGTTEIAAPLTRINDGKMYIIGFKEASKLEALKMFMKVQDNGSHLNLEKTFYREVSQLKFIPSKLTIIIF